MTTTTETYPLHAEKKKHFVQPEGMLRRLIWRAWIWLSTTFALSFMEPWEIILIFGLVGIMTIFLGVAVVRYVPHTIVTATHRALYYLSGSDSLDDIWSKGHIEL